VSQKDLGSEEQFRLTLGQSLAKNWHALAGALLVLLLGAGGYWGFAAYQAKANRDLRSKLYAYEKQISELEKKLYDEALKATEVGNKKGSKAKDKLALPEVKKDAASFEKNFLSLTEPFDAEIRKQATKDAARASAIFLADFYVEYDQPSRARELLTNVVKQGEQKGLIAGLAKMQLGGLLMSKEDCGQAVTLFGEILNEARLGFLEASALLRRGVCYLQLGNYEKAEADFQKIKVQHGDSEAARLADTYRRLGILEKK